MISIVPSDNPAKYPEDGCQQSQNSNSKRYKGQLQKKETRCEQSRSCLDVLLRGNICGHSNLKSH